MKSLLFGWIALLVGCSHAPIKATPPNGFIDYCHRNPTTVECGLIKKVGDINLLVNSSTTYKTDVAQYGLQEYWTIAGIAGDCEDFALAKLHKALQAGVDLKQLMLATCWQTNKVYHAVLLFKVGKEFLVLDNVTNIMYNHTQAKCSFDKRQREGGSRDWVSFY